MNAQRLSEHVYSVGVLNPSLRVFDIVMKADYGTSYNAYLITGEKNVLIDTVHTDFFDEYRENIESVIGLDKIDYLVMNHTELDHSGSLRKLLELNPDIKIYCTMAAQKYLTEITNRPFTCHVVKDGEKLSIGKDSIQFIVAPMLHWPDSMMAWYEAENALFSCDFLGCHFCEPRMTDENIRYKEAYASEFRNYYHGIFSPFKKYVLDGLKKIEGLDLHMVCPSHGPVLKQEIRERMEEYERWSTDKKKSEKHMLILYASAYNCTRMLAQAAKEAVEQAGTAVKIYDMTSTPVSVCAEEIAQADALLVGSCTINRDAPKVVWDVLSSIDAINTNRKPAGSFGSYGWSGDAVEMIESRLRFLKYDVGEKGQKVKFVPTEEDLQQIGEYAKGIASKIK